MSFSDADQRSIVARLLLATRGTAPPEGLTIEAHPLAGGLEAAAVVAIVARWQDARGRAQRLRVVAKRLHGQSEREAAVYERLVGPHASAFSPRLHGVELPSPGTTVLYLETVASTRPWPWRSVDAAATVLAQLARLHGSPDAHAAATALPPWDYEHELRSSGEVTLARLEALRRSELDELRRGTRWVRRLLLGLPELRRQLLAFAPLGTAALHGDVHTGNAFLRRRGGRDEPVLVDWGRARAGSPLEDVSSWLQSLGYWEPEARRRHDTLLAGYLSARGLPARPSAELRGVYWLAAASNALAGALGHHLAVARDPGRPGGERAAAVRAASDSLRIIRRADAVWS